MYTCPCLTSASSQILDFSGACRAHSRALGQAGRPPSCLQDHLLTLLPPLPPWRFSTGHRDFGSLRDNCKIAGGFLQLSCLGSQYNHKLFWVLQCCCLQWWRPDSGTVNTFPHVPSQAHICYGNSVKTGLKSILVLSVQILLSVFVF